MKNALCKPLGGALAAICAIGTAAAVVFAAPQGAQVGHGVKDSSGHHPAGREAWVGHFGIKMRVSAPDGPVGIERRIQYIDMGPGVPGLVEDLAPDSAILTLNGQDLPLARKAPGVLEVVVPASALDPFGPNQFKLVGWDAQGVELATFEVEDATFL